MTHKKVSAGGHRAIRGPRTARGKARSKTNALKHGLAASFPMPQQSAEIKKLARRIAGRHASDPARWHFAVIAAEAQIEIQRVRDVRRALLETIIGGASSAAQSSIGSVADMPSKRVTPSFVEVLRLERYEKRAMSRRHRALAML